jgi:hypothetical protein
VESEGRQMKQLKKYFKNPKQLPYPREPWSISVLAVKIKLTTSLFNGLEGSEA